jgi:hypothetical protein
MNAGKAADGARTEEPFRRLLALYVAAAMDENAAKEAEAILDRARSLLEIAALDVLAPDDPDPDRAPTDLASTYVAFRTAEVDLEVAVLSLARQHLTSDEWQHAVRLAKVLATSSEVRDDAADVVAEALTSGLERLLKEKAPPDLGAWIGAAREALAHSKKPGLLDQVLLGGIDASFAVFKLDCGLALARAYVAEDPHSTDRQAEAGRRVAGKIRQMGLAPDWARMIGELTLPHVQDMHRLMSEIQATVGSYEWAMPPRPSIFEYSPENYRTLLRERSSRNEKVERRYQQLIEGALAGALLRVALPEEHRG